MFKAAAKGATKKVISHLEKGDDINDIDKSSGKSLLHLAVEFENEDLLEFLVSQKEKGINLDIRDSEGDTPLISAVRFMNTDFVELLIRGGASIDTRDNEENSLLHIAASQNSVEIIKKLKHFGIDINSSNTKGTALHTAIYSQSLESAIEIIDSKKFDFSITDNDQNNALAKSVESIYPEIFAEILAKLDNLDEESRKEILNMKNKKGNTVFHLTAIHNKVNLFNLLEKKGESLGIDTKTKNNEGLTANQIKTKLEQKFLEEKEMQESLKKERLEKNKQQQEIKRRKEKEFRKAAYEEEKEIERREKEGEMELEKASKLGPFIFFTLFIMLFVVMYFVFKNTAEVGKKKEIIL